MTIEEFEALLDELDVRRRDEGEYMMEGHKAGQDLSKDRADKARTALLEAFRAEQARKEADVSLEAEIDRRGSVIQRLEARVAELEKNEGYECGKADGRSEAVQEIDQKTGGDGEYVYVMGGDPERHCPTPEAMIERIVERFDAAEARIAELEQRLAAAPSVPEELRRLSERATAGDWTVSKGYSDDGAYFTGIDAESGEVCGEFGAPGERDTDFIIAAANWLRSCIAAQPAPAQETGTPGESHE